MPSNRRHRRAVHRRGQRWPRLRWAPLAVPLAAVSLYLAVSPATTPAIEGQPAQGFAFEDINPRSASHHEIVDLRGLYEDRGVVLRFVASWCEVCRDELPAFERLGASGRAPVALVAADEHGARESMLIVAERSGLTAPLLFVPEEAAVELEAHYRHEVLPATYVIDRRGEVRLLHEGAMPEPLLQAAVDDFISR